MTPSQLFAAIVASDARLARSAMRHRPGLRRLAVLMAAGAVLFAAASGPAQTNEAWHLAAGPLQLDIYISKTAHLFHVVDQISGWSEFCHLQYVSYFQQLDGGLTADDRDFLQQHAAVRKKHGWGGGLEQTFYTPLDLEPALAQGVKEKYLTREEAETERRVLLHFQGRIERLMSEQTQALHRFEKNLFDQKSGLVDFATTMSRFTGATNLTVPFYLLASPDLSKLGGGYNGGRLTLEVTTDSNSYPTLLHELFHAFDLAKRGEIERAARSVPGLDYETMNEGLAYAYSPGIVHTEGVDTLLVAVGRFQKNGSSLKDAYCRFNTFGLALRPLLQNALADQRQTLETFLPRACDAWLVLVELDKARAPEAAQPHNYKNDPRQFLTPGPTTPSLRHD